MNYPKRLRLGWGHLGKNLAQVALCCLISYLLVETNLVPGRCMHEIITRYLVERMINGHINLIRCTW